MPKRKLKMTKCCIAARKRYRAKKRGGNIIRKMFKWTPPVFGKLVKRKKRTVGRGGGGGVNWNRGRPMKTTFFKYGRHGKRRAVPNPF